MMCLLINESMQNLFSALAAAMTIGGSLMAAAPANAESYYLVLGTYKQNSSGKPRVASYSSPSIQVIPMISLEQCEIAGEQIAQDIYKPIWYFDGRWTCVEGK